MDRGFFLLLFLYQGRVGGAWVTSQLLETIRLFTPFFVCLSLFVYFPYFPVIIHTPAPSSAPFISSFCVFECC